jgi:hypothetical protein
MSQQLTTAVAVVGIDIGKNSFRVVIPTPTLDRITTITDQIDNIATLRGMRPVLAKFVQLELAPGRLPLRAKRG